MRQGVKVRVGTMGGLVLIRLLGDRVDNLRAVVWAQVEVLVADQSGAGGRERIFGIFRVAS